MKDTDPLKACSSCKKEKTFSSFSPAKLGRYNLASVCKFCASASKRNRKLQYLSFIEKDFKINGTVKKCVDCEFSFGFSSKFYNFDNSSKLNDFCKGCEHKRYSEKVKKIREENKLKYFKCNMCCNIKKSSSFRVVKMRFNYICNTCLNKNMKIKRAELKKKFKGKFTICKECNNKKPYLDFGTRHGKYRHICKICAGKELDLKFKNNIMKCKGIFKNCMSCKTSKEFCPKFFPRNGAKLSSRCIICTNIILNSKVREKYNKNIHIKLRTSVSKCIVHALKKSSSSKKGKSFVKFVDFTIDELMTHIQSQFEPWMNWDNYGSYRKKRYDPFNQESWTWNIDHIIPQSMLPFSSMKDENFKKCWSLKNLRPLCSKQNQLDGSTRVRHIIHET